MITVEGNVILLIWSPDRNEFMLKEKPTPMYKVKLKPESPCTTSGVSVSAASNDLDPESGFS